MLPFRVFDDSREKLELAILGVAKWQWSDSTYYAAATMLHTITVTTTASDPSTFSFFSFFSFSINTSTTDDRVDQLHFVGVTQRALAQQRPRLDLANTKHGGPHENRKDHELEDHEKPLRCPRSALLAKGPQRHRLER